MTAVQSEIVNFTGNALIINVLSVFIYYYLFTYYNSLFYFTYCVLSSSDTCVCVCGLFDWLIDW